MASTRRTLDLDSISVCEPLSLKFVRGRDYSTPWSERTTVFDNIHDTVQFLQQPDGNWNELIPGDKLSRPYLDFEITNIDGSNEEIDRIIFGRVKNLAIDAFKSFLPADVSEDVFETRELTCHRNVPDGPKFSKHCVFPRLSITPYDMKYAILSKMYELYVTAHPNAAIENSKGSQIPGLDTSVYGSQRLLRAPLQQIRPASERPASITSRYIPWEFSDFVPMRPESEHPLEDFLVTYLDGNEIEIRIPEKDKRKIISDLEDSELAEKGDSWLSNEEVRQVISHIPERFADKYDTWVAGGFALADHVSKSGGKKAQFYDYFHEFSKLSPKYKEAETEKKARNVWENKANDQYRSKFPTTTFGSIVYWVKTSVEGEKFWDQLCDHKAKQLMEQLARESAEEGYLFRDDDERVAVGDDDAVDEFREWEGDWESFMSSGRVLWYGPTKQVFEKSFCKIESPICIAEMTSKGVVNLLSFEDCSKRFENLLIKKEVPKGGNEEGFKIVNVNFWKEWKKDRNMLTYSNLDFCPPPMPCPKNVYNMWKGFAVEAVPKELGQEKEAQDGLKDVLWHIEHIICKGDAASYKFVLDWHAHLFQRPGDKMRCMLVVYGRKRCGKDIIAEECIKFMVGTGMYFQTANMKDDLLSKHSDGVMNRLFVTCDELFSGDNYGLGGKWKNMLTSVTFGHEPKGLKKVTYNNLARFYGTANQLNSIPEMDQDEMRVFLVECSDSKRGQSEYFRPLVKALKKPCVQRAFYDYLLGVEITTDFDDIETRPVTDAMRDVQGMNLSYHQLWLAHWAMSKASSVDNSIDRGVIKISAPDMWLEGQKCNSQEEMQKIHYQAAKFTIKKHDFLAKLRHMEDSGVRSLTLRGYPFYEVDVQVVLDHVNKFNIGIGTRLSWGFKESAAR